MTEETKEGAAVTPATSAAGDQAPKGAATVDPIAAVENAATKEQRTTDSSFLDTLTPEQRRAAEKYIESRNSRAVNDALKTKTEKGEYMTADMVEARMRRFAVEERELYERKLQAREAYYSHLAENGILPGTPDYTAFEAEFKSGAYNPDAMGRKDVVERIAKNAGVGRFKPATNVDTRSPYLGTSGVSLKDLQANKAAPGTGDKMLDDAMELLKQHKPQ